MQNDVHILYFQYDIEDENALQIVAHTSRSMR